MNRDKKPHILIIDDDEPFIKATGAFLQNEGYTTDGATTGRKALQKLTSGRPQIVLLDLILPDADGVEILRRIRQIDRNIAVIAVTGHGDEQRAVNVMKAGSCDYLTKPFRFRELAHSIEKALMWRQIQMIEAMTEGYIAIDKRRVLFANRFMNDVLGYSREEMTDMEVGRLFPRESSDTFQPMREGDRQWHTCELEAVHKDGTRRTFEARIGGDKFQGMTVLALFLRDVTATKHLETALQETQSLYENLIQNANDAITLIDTEGNFALVNPKFCEISGYSEEEAKQLHFSELIHAEDLPLFTDRHRRTLAGEGVPSNFQFRITRKTGEVAFIDFSANVVTKGGQIIGIQAIARDITERKHAERELQDRMKELEKWHKLTVDRELRMVELKKRIEDLESQLAHLKQLKANG
jgi:PAS domain S-box-containing protein